MSGHVVLQHPTKARRADLWLLMAIAAATVVAHLVTGGRYGFHRDEFRRRRMTARHLAGSCGVIRRSRRFSVGCPCNSSELRSPISVFLLRSRMRSRSSYTGLIARELGGGRGAQLLAACASVPFALAAGALMQYVSFDYLAWVAVAYFVARLCRSGDPRWWLGIGAAIGFGMLSKYSIPFLVAGLAVGFFTSALRRQLGSKWLWLGVALALLLFLPNLLWQWRHDLSRSHSCSTSTLAISGLAGPALFCPIN